MNDATGDRRDRRWRAVWADGRGRAGLAGRRSGLGDRARDRDRWNPPPQRPSRLRHARPQALHLRARRMPGGSPRWRRTPARCSRPRRWSPAGAVSGACRSPHRVGCGTVTADAVVLATGARERPRPARLIPGDRPDGVYTTGQLQNLVHLHHARVGTSRCDRRRRTGQLVGGVDTARIRLRHGREWSAAIRTPRRMRRSGCRAGF